MASQYIKIFPRPDSGTFSEWPPQSLSSFYCFDSHVCQVLPSWPPQHKPSPGECSVSAPASWQVLKLYFLSLWRILTLASRALLKCHSPQPRQNGSLFLSNKPALTSASLCSVLLLPWELVMFLIPQSCPEEEPSNEHQEDTLGLPVKTESPSALAPSISSKLFYLLCLVILK